jgi:hypothetical protein
MAGIFTCLGDWVVRGGDPPKNKIGCRTLFIDLILA